MVFDSDGGRRSSRLYERSEKEGVCKREDSKHATPEDEVTKNDNEDRRRGVFVQQQRERSSTRVREKGVLKKEVEVNIGRPSDEETEKKRSADPQQQSGRTSTRLRGRGVIKREVQVNTGRPIDEENEKKSTNSKTKKLPRAEPIQIQEEEGINVSSNVHESKRGGVIKSKVQATKTKTKTKTKRKRKRPFRVKRPHSGFHKKRTKTNADVIHLSDDGTLTRIEKNNEVSKREDYVCH
jgi:hypothetical protein